MIINRQHWLWAAFVLLATAAAVLLFVANYAPQKLPFRMPLPDFFGPVPPVRGKIGRTPLGLVFGGVAYSIFIFAALYGLRRKRPAWRLGRLQTWLKAHIWLTLLTVPLVLLHCDFSAGGSMTNWLLALYAFVMASGFYGLALQHFLPRLMKENIPLETIFEQIPHIRQQLCSAAEKMRQGLEPALAEAAVAAPVAPGPALPQPKSSDPAEVIFKEALDREILPYLAARRGEKLMLGKERLADEFFRSFKIGLPLEWQSKVEDLQGWCTERRQLDLQTRLQHWLHGWLLVHAPASFVLLIFTAWHALLTLVYF
ncbi:MAG TPA: hypothetical protein VGK40_01530 [Verrucomicrobiae bacterium]